MDIKQLLEKMDQFAGQAVGQKSGDQWKGSDKAPPGKKLVGDSILKDLSKGPTPKSKEQELAEEWAAFNEEDLGVHPKRPRRKSDRHARGHEPHPRYKTIKTDEAADQEYTVIVDRKGRERPVTGTMEDLLDYFGYTLEVGKSYEHERGRYKINMTPKNVQQLVDNLNKAASNAAANSAPSTYYSVGDGQLAESHYKWEVTFKDGKRAVYHHNSPHYKDDTAASDIAYTLKSNPGAKVVATKDDKPFDWQSLLNEAYSMDPKPYKGWTYDVWTDDDGDVRKKFHSAKKDGQEVDLDWSPYDTPSQEDWQLWIDLGMPTREKLGLRGPIRSKDLTAMAAQGPQSTEESRGHTIIANKLKDIERAKKFASGELKIPTPQERRAELEKSKEAEKNQVKEYGANTSTASLGGTQQQQQSGAMPDVSKLNAQQKQQLALQLDPQAMKKAAAATSQIKSATGSSASGPNLLKALNAASQGKSVSGQDMTALKPMMDVVKKAATDPKLASQFKALASQAKQMK